MTFNIILISVANRNTAGYDVIVNNISYYNSMWQKYTLTNFFLHVKATKSKSGFSHSELHLKILQGKEYKKGSQNWQSFLKKFSDKNIAVLCDKFYSYL